MPALATSYSEIAACLPEHIAEFLGRPVEEIRERMPLARDKRNQLWIDADPQNEADRDALYGSLGELDLLKYAEWHIKDQEKQELHDQIVEYCRKRKLRVLDCGGGIGDTTLAFAANGVEVTYVDFPGLCSDFAKQRFEKFGCSDRVAQLGPTDFWERAGNAYDCVVSIDVLEHLENPTKHAARYLELLDSGGQLFITTYFRHSQRNPDHLPENDAYYRIFGGEPKTPKKRNVLTNLGFRRKRWYWFEKP